MRQKYIKYHIGNFTTQIQGYFKNYIYYQFKVRYINMKDLYEQRNNDQEE